MKQTRLSGQFPVLANALEGAPRAEWRRLTLKVCEDAHDTLSSTEERVSQALKDARSGKLVESVRLAELAELADEAYFNASDAGAEEETVLRLFSVARIFSALSKLEDPTDAAEALYEALHAHVNPEQTAESVQRTLDGT